MTAYRRELERARRDVRELRDLLVDHGPATGYELTVKQLAQAIGLAGEARRALLRAAAVRHTEGPQA